MSTMEQLPMINNTVMTAVISHLVHLPILRSFDCDGLCLSPCFTNNDNGVVTGGVGFSARLVSMLPYRRKFRRTLISSAKNFRRLKISSLSDFFVTFVRRNFRR